MRRLTCRSCGRSFVEGTVIEMPMPPRSLECSGDHIPAPTRALDQISQTKTLMLRTCVRIRRNGCEVLVVVPSFGTDHWGQAAESLLLGLIVADNEDAEVEVGEVEVIDFGRATPMKERGDV